MENNEQIVAAFQPKKKLSQTTKAVNKRRKSSLKQIDWSLEQQVFYYLLYNNSYVDQRQLITTVASKRGP